MQIHKGVVTKILDITKEGKMLVKKHKSNYDITVFYTSPYYMKNEGGIFAMPEVGAEILFVSDEDGAAYYYLSTIVSNPRISGATKSFIKDPLINEKYLYSPEGIPEAITVKDSRGAGLRISNYQSKRTGIGSRVQLNSVLNHKLILSDSPDSNCVILRNKDLDGITITAEKNQVHSANSIEIKSRGTQRCVVREGEYKIMVADGRDITLINTSTGLNAPYVPNPLEPSPRFAEQYGNINLVSKWKDINIYSDSVFGSVYISTPSQFIQIKTGGEVNIFGTLGINLNATGGINLKSSVGPINIEAPQVNIKSTVGNINLDATANLAGEGNTGTYLGSGRAPLHLNLPSGSGAKGTSIIPPRVPIPNAYNK